MSHTSQLLDRGFEQHQQGKLAEAESLYRQILAQNPEDVNALHLLGLVHYQRGDHGSAIAFIEQALAVKPDFAMARRRALVLTKHNGQNKLARGTANLAEIMKALRILPRTNRLPA